ncbi:uncharacterized protein LOC119074215 [Bradysia coprophila]|uniref:uncharacterized protein LOC119074215 n=1 Tax=Bradysia coprophila TaxID=38358 RepID=UPI00187DAB73|nr:uncharacterized protein LOC119074215 [Bradysia coprophila]
MSRTRVHFGVLAGICASLGSVFGKLMSQTEKLNDNAGNIYFGQLLNPLMLKLICFVLMLTFNALVWTFFVKALHQKGGSLVATVTSAATNYAVSALLGSLIFGETSSLLWWFGTSLVIMGVVLMTTDRPTEENAKTK